MKEGMDKLLRRALDASAGRTPRTPCLDAEILAALAEGSLAARERSAAESHLADCARCQAMAAALARAMPPPAPRAWWRSPAFAWLAPITAVAAALLVWTNVVRRENTAPAVAPLPQLPPPVESVAVAPPPAALSDQQAGSAAAKTAPAAAARDMNARARQAAPSSAPAAAPKEKAEADRLAEQRAAGATPAPAAPPALAEAVGIRGAAAGAPEPAPRAVNESTLARSAVAGQMMMKTLDARGLAIDSPDAASRWRIGPGSVVEHSADGGDTWQPQATGAAVPLTAGAAPARAVCWLVGRYGTVLLTVNEGRTWQRLSFPAQLDLRAVRATDEKTATVFAADGRSFSTSDGGTTWRQ